MPYAQSLTSAHAAFLTDLFPGDGCVLAPEALNAFATDASRERAVPWSVVRPENREQIVELLRWADAERMPIYGRSRGTGQVGNAVPVLGGVVVSMLRMNRIITIDDQDFVAELEPGVVTAELQAACAKKKLFYPPDPASVKTSTVGGNISTCAGGLRAVKYGVTRDWVLGLEAVLPGGKVLTMGGRSHKDVVGLDLKRLFVGANGKLGLITGITVKLVPLPESSTSVLAGFSDLASAMDGAMAVFQAGLLPSACEFMDVMTLKAVRMGSDIPLADDAEAALLFKLDGTTEGVAAEVRRLNAALKLVRPVSVVTGSGADEEALWAVRRDISPASYRLKPSKISEDISVPRSKVARLVETAQAAGRDFGLPVLCYGHLGDGNIHTNLMHDAAVAAEVETAHKVKELLFRAAVELGGTISGEHGTGLTKASFVAEQLSAEELRIMTDVRRAFDPHEIMNPGKGW
ncbi:MULTISPECIES: FAD-linked oxidase C-terminal domain-containing protein [unclassified Pseudodesulfovibrio]|uniref:FAD-binding oxidoreductase n=1 Tax=unclassified Pseudodesulfovibrio TaxID=2661612 RepID=UPI000FEB7E74|nr:MULTISPECIES: FAD-linked oxidase C-terminal domain-containing protein [unclassified Pseudodesulfovibrio]MCJ2165330.1 FAD-binding protein [Pseudodesulfovibrio sp. S3-i]RWU02795.1 FAD-binding protein [Pseudodesulfovibrio sp. S3]